MCTHACVCMRTWKHEVAVECFHRHSSPFTHHGVRVSQLKLELTHAGGQASQVAAGSPTSTSKPLMPAPVPAFT